MSRPQKKKIYEYFSSRDNVLAKEAIFGACRNFNIAKSTARKYYAEWRKMYMSGDIKPYNHADHPWGIKKYNKNTNAGTC